MNDLQRLPKLNTRLMEDEIVKLLLGMKAVSVDYPRELYEPRRDAYLAQIETVKATVPGGNQGRRTEDSISDTRKAA